VSFGCAPSLYAGVRDMLIPLFLAFGTAFPYRPRLVECRERFVAWNTGKDCESARNIFQHQLLIFPVSLIATA